MISFVIRLFTTAVSFFIVSRVLPGFRVKTFQTALTCAVVLWLVGLVAGFLAPLLILPLVLLIIPVAALTGPLAVIPMLLLVFVLQAVLLVITDQFIDDFEIDGWGTAFIASLLMTLIQFGFACIGLR